MPIRGIEEIRTEFPLMKPTAATRTAIDVVALATHWQNAGLVAFSGAQTRPSQATTGRA